MAGEQVRLLDPHQVEVEVSEDFAHLLEGLGWVRSEPKKGEPARRAKILPAPESEDDPPKAKGRRD